MSGATKVIGTGPGAWFGYLGSTLASYPGRYRTALRRRRTRTILLTILVIGTFIYPIIHSVFLAGFSRNVVPLPLPDDTVMTVAFGCRRK